ncbi:hypothetical protein K438DRAFT_1786734 [Mycena galopus ATCC 62051]|nr:hypothetical protein K438DRAFT_1786734 [Mycena galopus ATCC 62051]
MASGSKRTPVQPDKPAPRQSKAKTPGASGDGSPAPRVAQPPPTNRTHNPQMASRRAGLASEAAAAAAALKLAEDRSARDARAASRADKDPAAPSSDGAPSRKDGDVSTPAGTPPVDTDSSSGKDTATAPSGYAATPIGTLRLAVEFLRLRASAWARRRRD